MNSSFRELLMSKFLFCCEGAAGKRHLKKRLTKNSFYNASTILSCFVFYHLLLGGASLDHVLFFERR
jgi:hypothetical protein